MLKSWVKSFLILILALILIAAFFRHTFCRLLIEAAVGRLTGLRLSIEDLNLDVLNNTLHIRGITLSNPPGFQNEILGKAEEILIKYDPSAFLRGKIHLRLAKVDLNEINIIRNEEGSSNVSAFKERGAKAGASTDVLPTAITQKQAEEKEGEEQPKFLPKFLIERLELSLEKATFMNYKAEIGESAAIIFTLKGPFVFKNVSNLGYVANTVSAKGGFRKLLEDF